MSLKSDQAILYAISLLQTDTITPCVPLMPRGTELVYVDISSDNEKYQSRKH